MQQELLIGNLTQQGLVTYPSRTALVWRDQEYTYLGLNGLIDTVAVGLSKIGVRQGDRVALYTHNLPQFVQAYYALARLGAIAVPISIHWSGRDLHYLLSTVKASGIITISPLVSRVREVRGAIPELKWIVEIEEGGQKGPDTVGWQQVVGDLLDSPTPVRGIEGIDPAMIVYTAGTSAPPKPALLSHFNLLANCQQVEDMPLVDLCTPTRPDPNTGIDAASDNFEISLITLPLSELFSLNIGLNMSMKLGGTAVIMENFEADQAVSLIEQHKCTLIFGSPAVYTELTLSHRFTQSAFKLNSLKYAFSFGGPLPVKVSNAFQERTGVPIFNTYGAVEASPVILCTASGQKLASSLTAGFPLGVMEVKIVDREGKQVQPGQAGHLVAQGPNIMLGYYDPATPDEPIPVSNSGWYTSDDIAAAGEDGSITIIERKEDIMMIKDRPVFPRAVEQILLAHEEVKEASAILVGDGYGGNRMVAFIVPVERPLKVTEADLLLFCRKQLPGPACPQRIYLYTEGRELPRLPDGRIWRRALRSLAETIED